MLTEVCRGFPNSLQGNARLLAWNNHEIMRVYLELSVIPNYMTFLKYRWTAVSAVSVTRGWPRLEKNIEKLNK